MVAPSAPQLQREEKTALLKLARDTLQAACSGESPEGVLRDFRLSHSEEIFRDPIPCFVSLHTRNRQLRGCVGCTRTGDALMDSLFQYSLMAGFEDPRFPPLTSMELQDVKISISLLGPLTPIASLSSLQIGKHGLLASLGANKGLLLAKVAVEFGWNAEELKQHTLRKAGIPQDSADRARYEIFEEISFEENGQGFTVNT